MNPTPDTVLADVQKSLAVAVVEFLQCSVAEDGHAELVLKLKGIAMTAVAAVVDLEELETQRKKDEEKA